MIQLWKSVENDRIPVSRLIKRYDYQEEFLWPIMLKCGKIWVWTWKTTTCCARFCPPGQILLNPRPRLETDGGYLRIQ